MEEASGVDLDWFWRGWFYTTDHVDISLDRVFQMEMDTENPDIDLARAREDMLNEPAKVGVTANEAEGLRTWVQRFPDIRDFYDENDIYTVTNKERNEYHAYLAELDEIERQVFNRAVDEDAEYYALEFSNVGGLVMPIILGLEFNDGTSEKIYIPAEIWRKNPHRVSKLLVFEKGKELTQIVVDPDWETADADLENNYYHRRNTPSRVEAFKFRNPYSFARRDIMQDI